MMIQNNLDIFTVLINQYTQILSSDYQQFLIWGQWLFYGFATISIVWICLWRAFDHDSITDSMPLFLKEFFLIALFYTIMTHASSWLFSMVDSAQAMGEQLTHQQIDPGSIIQQGLTIANQVLIPLQYSSVTQGFGSIVTLASYFLIFGSFLAVAINLAVTLLTTTFLISFSGLTLAFGCFNITRSYAKATLEQLTGYTFKLLSLYLMIYAGSSIFTQLANYLPKEKITSFDIYAWATATALLFSLLSYVIPKQIKTLFSNNHILFSEER